MKRYFLLFLIALVSKSMNGQGEESSKIKWGVFFSPGVSHLQVRSKDDYFNLLDFTNDPFDLKFAYSLGCLMNLQLSQFWGVEIGVQYANRGFQGTNEDPTFGDYLGNDNVYETNDPPISSVTIKQNYHYLELPFRFTLIAGKGNFRFITGLGIAPGILIAPREVGIIEYEDGDKERKASKVEDIRSLSLTPAISLGLEYHLNNDQMIRLEPNLGYSILSLTDSDESGSYLLTGGVRAGFYF